ncbi:hypothetical protein [Streptomyces sp. AF1A]|uniref:hypothetical protein n=1 Tax=Streptomyces sp. AF1A TaxID=3394350 RepID=UPI0039BCC545
MRVTPLHGVGITWLKCPACGPTCRPAAVGPNGGCPLCGTGRLLKLSFGGTPPRTAEPPIRWRR